MKRIVFIAFLCALSVAALGSGRQVTIPATRVRIVYKETGQPAEWVMIDVTCLRTHLTRAERKELFEREKREYDALVAQGKQIPYQDFSDWRSEQFKTERSCGWRDFLHAEDGWITIPEISNVRMDSYEIEVNPAGGHTIYVVDPPRYNKKPWGHVLPYFDEKTFPKFAALPEKDRVLEAPYIAQCGIPPGTLNPTYEEGRFFLATYKIILDHWPGLSAALGCGYGNGGHAPYFKSGYWGFLTNCCLTMRSYVDPSYSLPGVPVIPAAQRADLLGHTRQLICVDIRAKQALWGETGVSPDLLDLDFFKDLHCECMGVKGLPPCEQSPAAQPAPSTATPARTSPQAPPPASPAPLGQVPPLSSPQRQSPRSQFHPNH